MFSPLDLLYPPKCGLCSALLKKGDRGLCAFCREKLGEYPKERETEVPGGFRCAVAFPYTDEIRTAIHRLKFEGAWRLGAVLGDFLAEAAAVKLMGAFDSVTYVPVSRRRRFDRGYDQSRLIAAAMAQLWEIPLLTALEKVVDNRPQSSLEDAALRRTNVTGCYVPTRDARGRRLLLVDDVITTGATMQEAAETLLLGGAVSVVCAAVASPRRG